MKAQAPPGCYSSEFTINGIQSCPPFPGSMNQVYMDKEPLALFFGINDKPTERLAADSVMLEVFREEGDTVPSPQGTFFS